MDKILRINMGASGGPQFAVEQLGAYAGLGGRAMTSAVVNAEVPALCHPLGADNKLIIAPGMLSGSAAGAVVIFRFQNIISRPHQTGRLPPYRQKV